MPSCLLLIICFLSFGFAACSGFEMLTDIDNSESRGPEAKACMECHAAQYSEWLGSAHAQAYSNAPFQEAFTEAGDDDCLGCHAPLTIVEAVPRPRTFHVAAGVDCVACHYYQGRMHGPHVSSALFQPHPIQGEDPLFRSDELCGKCHGETLRERLSAESTASSASCLSCHGAPRRRTASQGSGLFTRFLVSFEDEVDSHSHGIGLPRLDAKATPIPLHFSSYTGMLTIINELPHNLPTGTYGDKAVELHVSLLRDDRQISSQILRVGDATHSLSPGEQKVFPLVLQENDGGRDAIALRLVRTDDGHGVHDPVVLFRQRIPLPSGKK